jgi:sulfate permease
MLVPFLVAMFLAVNMGGSGTGPSFSAAFGANAIRRTLIPGIFGIMVFLGAVIAGKQTANTVGTEILNPYLINNVVITIVFFAVAVSLFVANIAGIPQSTSQSTIFALAAPGIYFKDFNPKTLFYEIIPTWLILPLVSLMLCFVIGRYIYKPLRRRGYTISSKINNSYVLKGLLVAVSLYVAFSIGANNVANAVGPITSMTINELGLDPDDTYWMVTIFSILIIAPCFGIGSSIFGHKILRNTGKELFLFGRIEAVIIAFVSASLLLLASLTKGIPTSLVQLNVGAILGIGIAKLGIKNIFRKTEVRKFFGMWAIAPIIAFCLSLLFVYIADVMDFLY